MQVASYARANAPSEQFVMQQAVSWANSTNQRACNSFLNGFSGAKMHKKIMVNVHVSVCSRIETSLTF